MIPVSYYDHPSKIWWAYWTDDNENQICDAVFAATRDKVLIYLGEIKESVRVKQREEQTPIEVLQLIKYEYFEGQEYYEDEV
jgi:hypothetical protein